MEILELLNTIAVTFIATEVALRSGHGSNGERSMASAVWEKHWVLLVILALLNLLLPMIRWSDHPVMEAVDAVIHLPWRLLDLLFNLQALVASLATVVCGALVASCSSASSTSSVSQTFPFSLMSKLPSIRKSSRANRAYVVILLSTVFISSYLLTGYILHQDKREATPAADGPSDDGSRKRDATKATVSMAAYATTFLLDVRRFCQPLEFWELVLIVAKSILFTLPIIPLVAVLISFLLLILISIVENVLKMDPSFLNWPVYYLTLYGPFAAVYVQAKRLCIERVKGSLPFSAR